MEHRTSTRARLVAVLALLVIVASACAQSGEPTGFDQQAGPIGEELAGALPELDADTELPLVERNFLESCTLGENSGLEELSVAARADTCRCSYDALESFYREAATGETAEDREADAYSAFKDLDESLREATGVVPANIQTILDGCRS